MVEKRRYFGSTSGPACGWRVARPSPPPSLVPPDAETRGASHPGMRALVLHMLGVTLTLPLPAALSEEKLAESAEARQSLFDVNIRPRLPQVRPPPRLPNLRGVSLPSIRLRPAPRLPQLAGLFSLSNLRLPPRPRLSGLPRLAGLRGSMSEAVSTSPLGRIMEILVAGQERLPVRVMKTRNSLRDYTNRVVVSPMQRLQQLPTAMRGGIRGGLSSMQGSLGRAMGVGRVGSRVQQLVSSMSSGLQLGGRSQGLQQRLQRLREDMGSMPGRLRERLQGSARQVRQGVQGLTLLPRSLNGLANLPPYLEQFSEE